MGATPRVRAEKRFDPPRADPHIARMILLIDNYDSFTFNLVHYLGELGAECDVRRNDALSPREAMALESEAIVLSPGPCSPNEAGICCDLIREAAGRIPIFGVCLGHQAIGQVFGAEVVRAPSPMHGKVSPIEHDGSDVFEGLPSPFRATRYRLRRAVPPRKHRLRARPCDPGQLPRAGARPQPRRPGAGPGGLSHGLPARRPPGGLNHA